MSKELVEMRLEMNDDGTNAIDFIKQELHEYIETERISYLQYFQEAILEKFGFLRNAAIVKTFDPKDPKDEESVHFIHCTGGMFVLIPNYTSSYLGMRSRHSSANTANVAANQKKKETLSSFEESLNNKLNMIQQPLLVSPNTIKLNTINENQTTNVANLNHETLAFSSSSSSSSSTNQTKRDRSNSKSQQLEFLRLNKNYLNENTDMENALHLNECDLMPPPLPVPPPPSPPQQSTISKAQDELTSNFLKDMDENDGMFRSKPFYVENEGCFVGFLWSWNFMLGKKWRSQFTGDESFQDNMLADFRLFCSNSEGRLATFFGECKNSFK